MGLIKRYTFQPRISAGLASQLNTNFDDVIDAFNNHRHTGVGTDANGITTSGLAPGSFLNVADTWTPFTSTWAANSGTPTLGNGTLNARYFRAGKFLAVRYLLVWGSTTSAAGTGLWNFTLPFNNSATGFSEHNSFGDCYLEDKAVVGYFGCGRVLSSQLNKLTVAVYGAASTYVTDGSISASVPFTWGSGDFLQCIGITETV